MPKTGIDRHNEHLVDVRQDFLQHRRWGRRVDDHPSPFAQCLDALHSAVQIAVTFPVDQERIRAGLGRTRPRKIPGSRSSGESPEGRRVTRRSDWTTGAPIERLGTKCPSITSTWMRSAPACSASATCSPKRAKSAERIDGASLTIALSISEVRRSNSRTDRAGLDAVMRLLPYPIGHLLSGGCFIDTLNGCIQQGVELGRGLLGRQPRHQRPRKARHNPVIPAQAPVAFFPCISARQCKHPHDLGMTDALGVEIVLLRQGELEHDHLTRWQGVKLLEESRLQQRFGLGFFRAVNIHFRFDDRYEARGNNLLCRFELLAHNVLDARRDRLG